MPTIASSPIQSFFLTGLKKKKKNTDTVVKHLLDILKVEKAKSSSEASKAF